MLARRRGQTRSYVDELAAQITHARFDRSARYQSRDLVRADKSHPLRAGSPTLAEGFPLKVRPQPKPVSKGNAEAVPPNLYDLQDGTWNMRRR